MIVLANKSDVGQKGSNKPKQDNDEYNDEDDDQEVEGLRVDSLWTTKNRLIEASKKRTIENESNNAFDPTSSKTLSANPELVY